jgi:hypothetical protein
MHPTKTNPLTPASPTVATHPSKLLEKNLIPAPTTPALTNIPRFGKTRVHCTSTFLIINHVLIKLQLQIILTPKLMQFAQTSPSPPIPHPRNNPHEAPRNTTEKTTIARDCRAKSAVVATDAINDSVTPLIAMTGM